MNEAATLLLLPGLDGTDVFFQPLLKALPESIRSVVVQYPPNGRNGYDDLVALVLKSTAEIPDYYVLGWSFAGPLALKVAAAEPARVRGVILAATFVRAPKPWMGPARFFLRGPVMGTWRILRRLPLWLLRPRSDPLRIAKTRTWNCVPAGELAHRLRLVAGLDVRAELRACTAPMLHLVASHDSTVPADNAAEILRERPTIKVETIDGRHLALFTNPQPAAAAIVRFIAECKPSPLAPP